MTKTLVLVLFAAAAFFGCATHARRMPKQGITGQITEVRGNQMPSPDRPASKGYGVSREVYFYRPTTQAQATGAAPLFNAINSKLIATTRSNNAGTYQISLPPGKYSVFVKDAGAFFAAETDGQGVLNPVEVQHNTLVVKNVLLNHAAAY